MFIITQKELARFVDPEVSKVFSVSPATYEVKSKDLDISILPGIFPGRRLVPSEIESFYQLNPTAMFAVYQLLKAISKGNGIVVLLVGDQDIHTWVRVFVNYVESVSGVKVGAIEDLIDFNKEYSYIKEDSGPSIGQNLFSGKGPSLLEDLCKDYFQINESGQELLSILSEMFELEDMILDWTYYKYISLDPKSGRLTGISQEGLDNIYAEDDRYDIINILLKTASLEWMIKPMNQFMIEQNMRPDNIYGELEYLTDEKLVAFAYQLFGLASKVRQDGLAL